MASSNKHSKLRACDEGRYTSDGLKNVTLDDGTRVVTSPSNDIKRPRILAHVWQNVLPLAFSCKCKLF